VAAEAAKAWPKRREDLPPSAATRLSSWLRNYRPLSGIPDELFDRMGHPREYWLRFLGEFADFPEADAEDRFGVATRHIRDTGVTYRVYGEESERTWPLSPLPLILPEQEWAQIAAGVEQRANLMEALLQDFYGSGSLVAEGALPAAALTGSPDFIRALRGTAPPGGRFLQMYAADLGRGPDGRWWVLDDRTQAPSGAGYALENRLVLSRAFPNIYNSMNVRRLAPFFDDMRRGLAAGAGRDDPRICLLTPGSFSETYFEQAHLARYLGFLLVEGDDLVVRNGRVYVRTIAGLKRADVILRRVDAEFLDPLELNSVSRLGVPGLLDAIRQGGVAVLNMPGSGVLESKALQGFLPKLCRRLLGEDLKMPNVATWWCGQSMERDLVERDLESLVLAPAFNTQGLGSMSKPRLVADMLQDERAALLERMTNRPGDFVGQEVVRLSTTPVLRDGALVPAPFVLRVYVVATPEGMKVMPGGFCRTSDHPDARAISMGENAQTADVWVITDKPVDRVTLLANKEDVRVRRILGHLPSRAADNLFWLGRYLERAEATLRLVRSLCTTLLDAGPDAQSANQSLSQVKALLGDWQALDEANDDAGVLEAAWKTLHDTSAAGSVIHLVQAARDTAAKTRERLSGDFWVLLLKLETALSENVGHVLSEVETQRQADDALQVLSSLSGLAQENMNRGAGWRFLDMGRRIERGINICRFARTFAMHDATVDDLDLVLDLADSQITYRARYLVGLAATPVRDMITLDPFNPRSLAFQLAALTEHLTVLPSLQDDGVMERPRRILVALAAEVETGDAEALEADDILGFEQALMALSSAVGDRFFLQGANATPQAKLGGLG
jgi:uncharacterized circularly permuted ATP-grasp superfamily protein/uncharacterized alpha-E superfamily protein